MKNQEQILYAFILIYWLVNGLILCRGIVFRTKRLGAVQVPIDSSYPIVSIIVAARDEAHNIPRSISSFLAQNYPRFEVIAVDDRSSDGSSVCLAEMAQKDARLRPVRVDTLPGGWLGKTHALSVGAGRAQGEWLLFTDADVVMDPRALGSAVAFAMKGGWDHVTLFPKLDAAHYVESAFSNYFAIAFNTRYRPWRASDPASGTYVGIGAFNLVRRCVFEKAGGHKRLALDVADDMGVGKIMKAAGGRSIGLFGMELVRVRWVSGFRGVVRALHKNAFRGVDYSWTLLCAATIGLFIVDILPFLGVGLLRGWAQLFAAGSVAAIFCVYLAGHRSSPGRYFTFWTHPLSAALFLFVLWRSALAAAIGGVEWRGTRYPLKDLKSGMV